MLRRAKWLLTLLPLLLLGLAHVDRDPDSIGNWRSASRAPVGLAPDPAVTPEGVIQVYAARAVRWRGYLCVHTWIGAQPGSNCRGSDTVAGGTRGPMARLLRRAHVDCGQTGQRSGVHCV